MIEQTNIETNSTEKEQLRLQWAYLEFEKDKLAWEKERFAAQMAFERERLGAKD